MVMHDLRNSQQLQLKQVKTKYVGNKDHIQDMRISYNSAANLQGYTIN